MTVTRYKLLSLVVLAALGLQDIVEAQRGRRQNRQNGRNGEEQPETPQSIVNRGNEAFGRQSYREACRLYEEALARRDPALPGEQVGMVHQNLGHAHYRLENWESAIEAYSRSGTADRMQLIAQCHLQLGNHAEAAVALRALLVVFPDRATMREQLAQVLSMLGERAQAAAVYRSLLDKNPGRAALHRALASEQLALDQQTEAMDSLEAAWRLGERDPSLARLLGDLYLQRKMYLECASFYDRYLALSGEAGAEDHFRIGYAYYLGAEYASARKCFDKAVAADVSYAKGYLYLGNIAAVEGEKDRAIAEYRTALKSDPALSDAHEALGGILLECGDFGAAASTLATAIHCGARSLSVHYNRVVALIRGGKRADAIAALKQAMRVHPGRRELRVLLGMIVKAGGA